MYYISFNCVKGKNFLLCSLHFATEMQVIFEENRQLCWSLLCALMLRLLPIMDVAKYVL